jgi:hypothetical protein
MEHVIQVELKTNTTHMLTWLDTALKPKPGMVLFCKGDLRSWTVVHAYTNTARGMNGTNIGWRVCGGQGTMLVS